MKKTALTSALLALIGTVLVAPSAAAADLPAPTVSITPGQEVSELQPLIVSDLDPSALSVSVVYAGHQLPPLPVTEESPGVFTAVGSFETWGVVAGDHDLVVAQCTDALGTECGTPTDPISTTLANPSPTPELSRSGSQFSQPFDLTVHLPLATGNPRVGLSTDGDLPVYVDPEAATPVPTGALSEDSHHIDITVCSEDETRCTPGDGVDFDVIRTVQGALTVSDPAFSPKGVGQPDTIDFDYTTLDASWDSAGVEVRNAADVLVFESAVPIPEAPVTEGSLTHDGKNDGGAFLPDGDYTANLVVTRTLDSGDVASSTYAQPFTVDNTALAPLDWKSSRRTIYPSPDGYRDTTTFTYGGDREPYTQVELRVRNASNILVRTKPITVPADAIWGGRNNAGVRVPEGSYTARLRVVDELGNVGVTPTADVNVNDAKLVTVTRAVTVTPSASRIGGRVGACSTRRTPSLHGWAGSTSYLSNNKCRTTFDASVVWTVNRVRLASAVKYRWVRLGWYGGPTSAATHHRASAAVYGVDNGTPQGWFNSLDYLAGQYLPSWPASQVVKDRYVSWGFQTDRGNRYDVKSFTITYRSDVLR